MLVNYNDENSFLFCVPELLLRNQNEINTLQLYDIECRRYQNCNEIKFIFEISQRRVMNENCYDYTSARCSCCWCVKILLKILHLFDLTAKTMTRMLIVYSNCLFSFEHGVLITSCEVQFSS